METAVQMGMPMLCASAVGRAMPTDNLLTRATVLVQKTMTALTIRIVINNRPSIKQYCYQKVMTWVVTICASGISTAHTQIHPTIILTRDAIEGWTSMQSRSLSLSRPASGESPYPTPHPALYQMPPRPPDNLSTVIPMPRAILSEPG